MAALDTAGVLAAFRVVAPEFASTSDDDVNSVTSLIGPNISSDAFGSQTNQAIARLVAHELTLQARAANATAGLSGVGSVTQARAGDLSLSFGGLMAAVSSHDEDYFRQTIHGLAYLQIRASRSAVGFGIIA